MGRIVKAMHGHSSSRAKTVKGITFCIHNIQITKHNVDIALHKNWNSARKLHRFGRGPFCEFKIQDHLDEKGLYCFLINHKVKYIGKVTGNSAFRKRFNQGYGHISPYNCYQRGNGHSGGRITNCHVNCCVNQEYLSGKVIQVGFCTMNDDIVINKLEKDLINDEKPKWNIQYKYPNTQIKAEKK